MAKSAMHLYYSNVHFDFVRYSKIRPKKLNFDLVTEIR